MRRRSSARRLNCSPRRRPGGPRRKITVQPGFTLWGIARESYGDGVMYVRVYEANKRPDPRSRPDLSRSGLHACRRQRTDRVALRRVRAAAAGHAPRGGPCSSRSADRRWCRRSRRCRWCRTRCARRGATGSAPPVPAPPDGTTGASAEAQAAARSRLRPDPPRQAASAGGPAPAGAHAPSADRAASTLLRSIVQLLKNC